MIRFMVAWASIFTRGVESICGGEPFRNLQGIISTSAGQQPSLTLAAAGPLLHVPLSLFVPPLEKIRENFEEVPNAADEIAFFKTLLDHETGLRISGTKGATVLCGSQRTAKEARAEISAASGSPNPPQVRFVSRKLDVACWRSNLSPQASTALAASSNFFHVGPLPAVSKLAPTLIERQSSPIDVLRVDSVAMGEGITVFLDPEISLEARKDVLLKWKREGFGLVTETASASLEQLVPAAWLNSSQHAGPWRELRDFDATSSCADLLQVLDPAIVRSKNHFDSVLLRFNVREQMDADSVVLDKCLLGMLAYYATHAAVYAIEPTPKSFLQNFLRDATPTHVSATKARSSAMNESVGTYPPVTPGVNDDDGVKSSNHISVGALQSGDSNNMSPFWDIGIDGTGEYVQVADTGFDDGSCFLIDDPSTRSSLTGNFNFDVQIARSLYNNPTTDLSRRKIVQYIKRSDSFDYFGYDYADGHGTHVAGTVAGSIADSDSRAFTEDFSGMAPGAKIMAYDFGTDEGALDAPTDYSTYIFEPAYDAGARILTNSWGSTYDYYHEYARIIDVFAYDNPEALVLFAAGNDAYGSENGDKTIIFQALAFNALTVGAAETAVAPDTVAYFSSRGPTFDGRLKPDLVGPGHFVYSAAASGSAGLDSCSVVGMAGTSMATPAVAGAAALARQFLLDGKHLLYSSTGFYGSNYSIASPSGALIKAILVGSTTPLTQGYDSVGNTVTLSDFYDGVSATADDEAWKLGTGGAVDFHQGFGHVRLSNVFSLTGAFDTFLHEACIGAYGSWTLIFTVASAATEVDVTLVWWDPPSEAYCDYYDGATCLVHDLDLRVIHAGTRLYSNFGAASTGAYAGQEDTKNSVEKITIDTSSLNAGDTIEVVVATDSGLANYDSQSFALVVTGNLLKIHSPSPASTTRPSPMPSVPPTTSDTITLAVAIAMTTSQGTISSSEEDTLKGTIASTANVASEAIKNFGVTITSSRRRRLLATFTWSVDFEIVTELSSTSSSSPDEYADSVASTLKTNLASAVQASMTLTVAVDLISASAATRNPSYAPTYRPSKAPTIAPSVALQENTFLVIALIGASVGALLAGISIFLYSRRARKMTQPKIKSGASNVQRSPQEQANDIERSPKKRTARL